MPNFGPCIFFFHEVVEVPNYQIYSNFDVFSDQLYESCHTIYNHDDDSKGTKIFLLNMHSVSKDFRDK
jgi:hypothetical protein